MTTAVTGASGHIGANLVRAMLEQGRPVRCLMHRSRRALEGLDIQMIPADILDRDSLMRAFEGAEVVYHLAAGISIRMNDWARLEQVNVTGTRNVVEACLASGVRRLVHFSSIHAIVQEPLDVPVEESRPLASARRYPPYDRSKAAAELEVRRGIERGLDAVIISPTAVLGPQDFQPSYFGRALLALARGRLPAMVTGGFDWVDVRDVVKGALAAEKQAPTGAKYLLSGHWLSMCDVSGIVSEITGAELPRFVCPLWLARLGAPAAAAVWRLRGREPLYTGASMRALKSNRNISHDRAALELGYGPRPFRETLADTLAWFKDNGYLEDTASEASCRS